MTTEIIIAGQGGQGVLTLGHILAEAAFSAGLETTWLPSYGPEQRGGTCNATVVISSSPISSPIASRLDYLIAFNRPSVERFSPLLHFDGILISDAEGAFSAFAHANSCDKLVGIIMLGALLRTFKAITPLDVTDAIRRTLPPHRKNLIDDNIRALDLGFYSSLTT
ncbi:MAG: 2-oxoacid:acceptor oxidoreductase family protein [Bacteroidales bacterium]|nr:2-oxoacid:acceptor oxidoreductase family protein [Bacteroidales bacterium]